jgi:hypothetical protein
MSSRRRETAKANERHEFVLKILNLNGSSLQIKSKHRTSSTSTQKCGTSLELFEFQPSTIKEASNRRIHKLKIRIVDHDHFAVII